MEPPTKFINFAGLGRGELAPRRERNKFPSGQRGARGSGRGVGFSESRVQRAMKRAIGALVFLPSRPKFPFAGEGVAT